MDSSLLRPHATILAPAPKRGDDLIAEVAKAGCILPLARVQLERYLGLAENDIELDDTLHAHGPIAADCWQHHRG